jgi:hypothetical protein
MNNIEDIKNKWENTRLLEELPEDEQYSMSQLLENEARHILSTYHQVFLKRAIVCSPSHTKQVFFLHLPTSSQTKKNQVLQQLRFMILISR